MNARLASILPAALLTLTASAQQATLCIVPTLAIPDAAPGEPALVHLTLTLPAGAQVQSVSVELDITHPWLGDLSATLSRGSTSATLFDRIGIGGYPFACGGDGIAATFDDAATALPDPQCASGVVPTITGTVRPLTPLSTLATGEGDLWTLAVADTTPFDQGTLDRVCITLAYTLPDPACSPADVTATGSSEGVPDGVVDISDYSYYLTLWAAADARADLTTTGTSSGQPDGAVDVSDFSFYLSLWAAGCP